MGYVSEYIDYLEYPFKVTFDDGEKFSFKEEELVLLDNENNEVPKWKEFIDNVDKLTQRQDSTVEQLNDLIYVANKLGFYDASDWIKENLQSKQKN